MPRAATLAATVAGGPETVAVAPSTSAAVTSTGWFCDEAEAIGAGRLAARFR